MFKQQRRSLRERSIEFRDPLRPLTDAEADTARAIQVVALLEHLSLEIGEIKGMLKVLDKFLERTASDRGYRDPADMRALREGG